MGSNKLTKRQASIFEFIRKRGRATNQEIKNFLETAWEDVSRFTVLRDVEALLNRGFLARKGAGRNVYYEEALRTPILKYFDPGSYFETPPDKRKTAFERFDFSWFEDFKYVFKKEELHELEKLNESFRKQVNKLSPALLQREFERLTIELSWKSSQLEGNTYSLIDTEVLLKEHKEAQGHKRDEAIMILNHKKALDYAFDKRSDFRVLRLRKLENLHQLIVSDLGVGSGIRKKPVGITGTTYRPLDNEHQIRQALEEVIKIINGSVPNPFAKALAAIAVISYIQPFEDGNKRTGRLLGNAILLAHDACPLSYRSIDDAQYKKAMILFYEQNSVRYLKEQFVEQFKFAVQNYFLG